MGFVKLSHADSISPDLKKQVLERDNYQCRKCGRLNKLRVYHMNLSNYYDDDHVKDNLITLCGSCHTNLHLKKWKLEDIGIPTPKERWNILKGDYNISLADIQKELQKIDDTINLLV